MKNIFLYFFLLIFLSGCSTSYYIKDDVSKAVEEIDGSEIEYRILLIGDAGEPSADYREPVLDALEKRAKLLPEKTINIFLGDNVYPFGLEAEEDLLYNITKGRLDEQINVMLNSGTDGIFIPGNHDWGNGSNDGWYRVTRMGQYIDINQPSIEMLPKDGCPGPVVKDYGSKVRIIILDSQWWLHNDYKPDSTNSDCYPVEKSGIINSIDSLINTAGERFVIIAAHHPLNTYGPHGGYFDWKAHIFPLLDFNKYLWIPLPVIGSLYPLLRNAGITPQDMSNSLYEDYIERMEKVIADYNNIIYAAGHEHSIQVLEGVNNNIYLVSGYGAAVHANTLSYGDNSILSVLAPGFLQLDFLKDNRIRLAAFIVNDYGNSEETFSAYLFQKRISVKE
jgi:hypothetical protein